MEVLNGFDGNISCVLYILYFFDLFFLLESLMPGFSLQYPMDSNGISSNCNVDIPRNVDMTVSKWDTPRHMASLR